MDADERGGGAGRGRGGGGAGQGQAGAREGGATSGAGQDKDNPPRHPHPDEDSQWALLFNLADRSAGGTLMHRSLSTSTTITANLAEAPIHSPLRLYDHPRLTPTTASIAAYSFPTTDQRFTPTWTTPWDPFAMHEVHSDNAHWQPNIGEHDVGATWPPHAHHPPPFDTDVTMNEQGGSVRSGEQGASMHRALFAPSPTGHLVPPRGPGGGSQDDAQHSMDWRADLDPHTIPYATADSGRQMVPGRADDPSGWLQASGQVAAAGDGAPSSMRRSTAPNLLRPPSLLDRRLQRNSRLMSAVDSRAEYPFPTSEAPHGFGRPNTVDGPLRPFSTGPLDSSSSLSAGTTYSGSPSTSASTSSVSPAPAWAAQQHQQQLQHAAAQMSTDSPSLPGPSSAADGDAPPLPIAKPKAKRSRPKPAERSVCEQCGKTFAKAAHAKRHQVVHTHDRGFACPECGATFSRADSRDRHVGRRHGIDASQSKGKRKAGGPGSSKLSGSVTSESASATSASVSGSASASGSASGSLAKTAVTKATRRKSSPSSTAAASSASASLLPSSWRPHDLAVAAVAANAAASAGPSTMPRVSRINRNVGFNAPPSPSASTAGSATSSGPSSVASSPMLPHASPRDSLALSAVQGPPRLTPTPLGSERMPDSAGGFPRPPDGPGTPYPSDFRPSDDDDRRADGPPYYQLTLPQFDTGSILRDAAQLPIRTPTPANLAGAGALGSMRMPSPMTEQSVSLASLPVPVSVEQSLEDQASEMRRGLRILGDIASGAGGAGGHFDVQQLRNEMPTGPLPMRDMGPSTAGGTQQHDGGYSEPVTPHASAQQQPQAAATHGANTASDTSARTRKQTQQAQQHGDDRTAAAP